MKKDTGNNAFEKHLYEIPEPHKSILLKTKDQFEDDEMGAKSDAGKVQLRLIDYGFLQAIARVREYGVKKYGDSESWKTVPNGVNRYTDAMLRHLFATLDCGHEINVQKLDPESGFAHWDHFMCNVMFLDRLLRDKVKNDKQE